MREGARRERRRNWASNASPDGTSLDQTSTRCVGSRRRPHPRPCEQRPDPARPRGLVLPAASSRSHPSSRGPPLSCCLCSQHPLHTGPGERGLGHLPQRKDSSSHVHRKACAQLFKAALFAVEKTQKNLCLRRANGSADCRARVLWSITQRRKGVPHGARSAVSTMPSGKKPVSRGRVLWDSMYAPFSTDGGARGGRRKGARERALLGDGPAPSLGHGGACVTLHAIQ